MVNMLVLVLSMIVVVREASRLGRIDTTRKMDVSV